MKGQISAEVLILLVVIIGVVVIVASQLLQTAGTAANKIDEKTGELFEKTGEGALGGAEGEYCDDTLPCKESLSCNENICS